MLSLTAGTVPFQVVADLDFRSAISLDLRLSMEVVMLESQMCGFKCQPNA